MPRNCIADSSVLVALLNRDDRHHSWIASQAANLPWPWVTCEPVLTEAFYLVGNKGGSALKQLLRRGAVKLSFDLDEQLIPVLALMEKYADVPMSLADACLVRMSETISNPLVLTADMDFKIYRRHSRQMIPCLMP